MGEGYVRRVIGLRLSSAVLLFLIFQAASFLILEESNWDKYVSFIESEPPYRHMDWKHYHGRENYTCPCIRGSIDTKGGCEKVSYFKSKYLASVQVIEEYLMAFVEREKFNISSKCILHPDNDHFTRLEMDGDCGFCMLTLEGHEYSEILMGYEYYYAKYGRATACDMLQCYLVMNCRMKRDKIELNPEEVIKNRQLCERFANNCFPANEGPSENQLLELLLRQVCDAHTYSGRPELSIIDIMKKHASNVCFAILVSILLLLIFYPVGYLHKKMKYEKTELHHRQLCEGQSASYLHDLLLRQCSYLLKGAKAVLNRMKKD